MRQMQINFDGELLVDSFAGGGGWSIGMEAAMGRPVDIAINHDREAIAMHTANHPATKHFQEDIWTIDPLVATGGRPVGWAHFSPDCRHFSKAKGGKPVKKKIRGLAWVVLRWAGRVKPRIISLENVEEFQTWGPLKHGLPCPKRKGATYRRWINQLRALGYRVEWRELRACDYGAPTIRKRLFVIARRDGASIVWPQPTHGKGLLPYRTAAECIDWSLPCPSIFDRKRPLAEATLRRIAKGIQRYVIEAKQPFIVKYYGEKFPGQFRGQGVDEPLHTQPSENRFGLVVPAIVPLTHGGSDRVHGANEPLRTLTTAHRGELALVTPTIMTNNTDHPGAPIEKPLPTVTSRGQQYLVASFLAQHNLGAVGRSATKPMATATERSTQIQLVAAHLTTFRGTSEAGRPIDAPMPSLTAGGTHVAEVRAFLTKYYGTNVGLSPDSPLHAVTSKARFGLVTVEGVEHQIVDIGMRMLTPAELYLAQGFPRRYIIAPVVDGKPLTKTAQIRLAGNAVPPVWPEAIVKANYWVTPEAAQEVA